MSCLQVYTNGYITLEWVTLTKLRPASLSKDMLNAKQRRMVKKNGFVKLATFWTVNNYRKGTVYLHTYAAGLPGTTAEETARVCETTEFRLHILYENTVRIAW